MISRVDFNGYNNAVAELTSMASQDAQRQISAWMQLNPDASIAEIRNFAKETMDGLVQVYGEAASSLAAQWYDFEAGKAGKKLPVAITETTYDAEQVKRVAHYQAKKLADGDINGFLDACGEYMENATKQSLNSTILANVARDKEAGVRFARVTTGAETCSFCFMLSSRGAVYHSRKTAGEQNHYHRRCDCKIVPGFNDNTHDEIVEGYDPRGMQNRMALIEQQTGLKFGDKADMSDLSDLMHIYSSGWLMYGIKPEVRYASKQVEDRALQHEKATAKRIVEYGIDPFFVQDFKYVGQGKNKRRVGLADFDSGLEIKAIIKSKNAYGAVKNHLENTIGKENIRAVLIDITDAEYINDEECLESAKNLIGLYPQIPHLFILTKSKEIVPIK